MEKTVNNPETFAANQQKYAAPAAEQILEWFVWKYHPKTLLDVGCGIGCWMALAAQYSIDVTGIDHPCLAEQILLELKNSVILQDLEETDAFTKLRELLASYDVCLCLEVAEHLDASLADELVKLLTAHSSMVLFSAAIPNRVNTALPKPYNGFHKNEQWQRYWIAKFYAHGFIAHEIRHQFWDNPDIPHWYKQSLILFSNKELDEAPITIPDLVHPDQYLNKLRIIEGDV